MSKRTWKSFFSAIWKVLKDHWVLKLLSLLIAILFWSLAWTSQNPIRTKTLGGIPVNVLGESTLQERNLILTDYSLASLEEGVNVSMEVRQRDYNSLTNDQVSVILDLSHISSPGIHTVELTAEGPTSATLRGISPQSIDVTVDEVVTKQIPVDYNLSGVLPSGYWNDTPEITPNVITLRGAKTDLERVTRAQCEISLNGLTEPIWQSVNVALYDSEGNLLEDLALVDSLPSVIVRMDVLSRKTIYLNAAESVVGTDLVQEGYEVTGITATPETIELVGTAEELEQIDTIDLGVIDAQGRNVTFEEERTITLPDGVTSLSGTTVKIRVEIAPIPGYQADVPEE